MFAVDPDRPGYTTKGHKLGRRPYRGRSVQEIIRVKSHNGRDLALFLFSVLNGKVEGATVTHKLEACKELLDRGWGKATQIIHVDATIEHEFRAVYELALRDTETYQAALALANALCREAPALPVAETPAADSDTDPHGATEATLSPYPFTSRETPPK